jgi:pimeloyl-ACP methyl ester carboxylesterase
MAVRRVEHFVTGPGGVRTFALESVPDGNESGLPILLIHGLTRNHRDFEDLIPWLNGLGRRTIAVDVRGRGRSDRDPDPANYHAGIYVQDMAAVLGALGAQRAVWIGNSMGGLISTVAAMAIPQMVAGVLLNDVGPQFDPKGLARIQSYVGEVRTARDWDDAAGMIRAIGESAFPGRDHAFWLTFARRTMDETPDGLAFAYDPAISALTRAVPASEVPDAWPLFEALKPLPAAVVRGALSDLLAPETVARMKAEKPDLIVADVPGVGHHPLLDEPQSQSAILALLERTG